MDALISAERKIERAGEHLLPVLEEVGSFARSDAYSVVGNYNADTRRKVFKIAQIEFLNSIELGLGLGDAVHNLRAALDHLVWGLASKNSKLPIARRHHRNIFFPVTDTYQAFMTHPTIPYLTLEQIAVLETYQPFSGRDDKRLRHLNALWNADKHQVIQLVFAVIPQSGIKFRLNEDAGAIVDRWFPPKITFEPDAQRTWLELGWVEVSAPGPDPQVEVESLSVEILAGESPDAPEVEDLALYLNLVHDIIQKCSPFLEQTSYGLPPAMG